MKDLDKNVQLTIEYEITDYALKAGEKLMAFQLPEINYNAYEVGKPERDYPLHWDGRELESNVMTITIPKGYKVYYLPKKYAVNKPGTIDYTAQFEVNGQEITFNDQYNRQAISMSIEEYPVYKKCIETKAALAKEWIVLEKVKE